MPALAHEVAAAYKSLYCGRDQIPLHEPYLRNHELAYVSDCIHSGWVSSVGTYVQRFQEELAAYSGARYAVVTCNGTAALQLAMLAHHITAADDVLCPDLTFAATAAAITYVGARPVFLDIDADTLGLSPQAVREFIAKETVPGKDGTYHRHTGRKIAACIIMHNVGFPARMAEINAICKEHHILAIEDAAEALGSRIDGKMCGTFAASGIYSFNGNKIITTGGGGALVTDNEEIYKKALHLSTTAKVAHPYRYIHDDIGYNFRMPNLNAALGVAQLEQMDKILQLKKEQFCFLDETLRERMQGSTFEILTPPLGECNHWMLVAKTASAAQSEHLIESLNQNGVMARAIWGRLSELAPYKKYLSFDNPTATLVAATHFCLPNGVVQGATSK